jgi:ABC-type uncharacterized transport system permease subunit
MTSVPANIFLNSPNVALASSFASLAMWIILVALLAAFTWKRGVKHYTAAGI